MSILKSTKCPRKTFVSPKVLQTVGVALEDNLLVNSPGTDMMSLIDATGHDTSNYGSVNGQYWE